VKLKNNYGRAKGLGVGMGVDAGGDASPMKKCGV